MRKLWLVVMVCGGLLLVQERSAGADQGRSLGLLTSEKAAKKEPGGVKRTIKIMEDKLEGAKRTAKMLDSRYGELRSRNAEELLVKLKGLYEQYIRAMRAHLELIRQDKHRVTRCTMAEHRITRNITSKPKSIHTVLRQVESLLNRYNQKDSMKRLVEGYADNKDLVPTAEKMVRLIDRLIIVETQILKLTEYKRPIAAELSETNWDFRMNVMEAARAKRPPPERIRADRDEVLKRSRRRAMERERKP